MLIEFNATNFRSLRETQTLSLAASKYFQEMKEQNSFETGIKGLPRLLRSAVIYGPNASGKSNFLSSLAFMRYMVLSSAVKIQEGQELEAAPFLLDHDSKDKESEFEIIFIEEGVRYQYGFALNKNRVLREWLIAYPEGRPQRWFDREFDPKTGEYAYEFSSKFLGGRLRQDWKKATRDNALFFSVAVQFNSEQLKPVFRWFHERLQIVKHLNVGLKTFSTCETELGKKKVASFLNAIDLGIADIQIDKKQLLPDDLAREIPIELRAQLLKEIWEVKFLHKNIETGDLVPFGLPDESDGTKNLFAFAGPWLDVMENDMILLVDEIDTSLHPLVVHQLVRMLNGHKGKSQFVFTTHDTTLLSQDIMRRDQIWFIEKDKSNASKLYSLSDFKVREKEALERGYLKGRYGAIPFIRESAGG